MKAYKKLDMELEIKAQENRAINAKDEEKHRLLRSYAEELILGRSQSSTLEGRVGMLSQEKQSLEQGNAHLKAELDKANSDVGKFSQEKQRLEQFLSCCCKEPPLPCGYAKNAGSEELAETKSVNQELKH